MIKIIKDGKKEFTASCPVCDCEFSYELSDLQQTFIHKIVKCPCCGKDIIHKEGISQVAAPRNDTDDSITSDPSRINDNAIYQTPETLKLREKLTQQITEKYSIPCLTCSWYKQLSNGQTYVGDSPCQWCQYSGLKGTCTSTGGSNGN